MIKNLFTIQVGRKHGYKLFQTNQVYPLNIWINSMKISITSKQEAPLGKINVHVFLSKNKIKDVIKLNTNILEFALHCAPGLSVSRLSLLPLLFLLLAPFCIQIIVSCCCSYCFCSCCCFKLLWAVHFTCLLLLLLFCWPCTYTLKRYKYRR